MIHIDGFEPKILFKVKVIHKNIMRNVKVQAQK